MADKRVWAHVTSDAKGKRPRWMSGRAWLHVGERYCFHTQWILCSGKTKSATLALSIGDGDGDDGITLHISFPFLFNLFLCGEGVIAPRVRQVGGQWVDRRKDYELRYDLRFGALGSIWWKCGANPDSWDSSDPWWRQGAFHLDAADFLLGRPKATEREVDSDAWVLHLPEGIYVVRIRMMETAWKRARWPWPRRVLQADIHPERPVPIPGKGENDWDCEDDAVSSSVITVSTPEEALAQFRESILSRRAEYGGEGWTPTREVPA